jgi:hypothetical protein
MYSAPFTTIAVVDNGRAFISTSLLYLGVPHADLVALGALGIGVDPLRLHLVPLHRLNNRELLPQRRGEIRGFRSCCNGRPRPVCAWSETHAPTLPRTEDQPLFSAPQQSQWRIFFSLPLDAGRRLPQSVQKIKEPIAAMVLFAVAWSIFAWRISSLEFQARRSTGFLQRNPPENLVEPVARNSGTHPGQ